jgi:hypothetical protein
MVSCELQLGWIGQPEWGREGVAILKEVPKNNKKSVVYFFNVIFINSN